MERQVVAKYEKSKYDQNTADFLSYHHHIRFREHIVKWLQILNKKIKYYYSVSPSKDKKTYLLLQFILKKLHFVLLPQIPLSFTATAIAVQPPQHFSIFTFCLKMYMKVFYVWGRLKLVGLLNEIKIAENKNITKPFSNLLVSPPKDWWKKITNLSTWETFVKIKPNWL